MRKIVHKITVMFLIISVIVSSNSMALSAFAESDHSKYSNPIWGYNEFGESEYFVYTTLKINGKDYKFGDEKSEQSSIVTSIYEHSKNIKTWNIQGVEVKQIVEMPNYSENGLISNHTVKYEVTNKNSVNINFGLRTMLDTISQKDESPIIKIIGKEISKMTSYKGTNLPSYWQIFNSNTNPTTFTQGTILKDGTNNPTRFVIGSWKSFYNNIWNIVDDGSIKDDSAIALYWDESVLEANKTKYYETEYNSDYFKSHKTTDSLSIAITGSEILKITENGFLNNPINVMAYITNNKPSTSIEHSRIQLILPEGLKLMDGYGHIIFLNTLSYGDVHNIKWPIYSDIIKDDKTYEYIIIYYNQYGEKTIIRKKLLVEGTSKHLVYPKFYRIHYYNRGDTTKIIISGNRFYSIESKQLFKIYLKNNQHNIQIDSNNMDILENNRLSIDVGIPPAGNYNLVIDHKIYGKSTFKCRIIRPKSKISKIELKSSDGETDIYRIEFIGGELESIDGNDLLRFGSLGDYYTLTIPNSKNELLNKNITFNEMKSINNIKISEYNGKLNLTFSSSIIESASAKVVEPGRVIEVTIKGIKGSKPANKKMITAVNNNGSTYSRELTKSPKNVTKLKVGIFNLKGNFRSSTSPDYDYISSGTVSIGDNIIYTGGRVYVKSGNVLSFKYGNLYIPLSNGTKISLSSVDFDIEAKDGAIVKGIKSSTMDFGISKFSFDNIKAFKDERGSGLSLSNLSVKIGRSNYRALKQILSIKLEDLKIYEVGKIDVDFKISISFESKVDIKGVAKLKKISGDVAFNNLRIKEITLAGEIMLYFLQTTFGASLSIDWDHIQPPFINNFEISATLDNPLQIPIGPLLPSADQGNSSHLSYFMVLRSIGVAGENLTAHTKDNPRSIYGKVGFSDGISPEFRDKHLLSIDGKIEFSKQYVKISGDFDLYMFTVANGETTFYWKPQPKLLINGNLNIVNVIEGITKVVVAKNKSEFLIIGKLKTPKLGFFKKSFTISKQSLEYNPKAQKFYGKAKLFGWKLGMSIDVRPNVKIWNRLKFASANGMPNLDKLINKSKNSVTGNLNMGSNIELISSYNRNVNTYFAPIQNPDSEININIIDNETITFDVKKSYETLIISVDFENKINSKFTLINPNGDIYPLVKATDDIKLYANYFEDEKGISVILDKLENDKSLIKGKYTIKYQGAEDFTLNLSYLKPVLEIKELSVVEKSSGIYRVSLDINQEINATTSSTIELFLSDEKNVFVGEKVKSFTSIGTTGQAFDLDLNSMTNLTGEKYYLFAEIRKEGRTPDKKFAKTPLEFKNTLLPSSPVIQSVKTGNNKIDVVFTPVLDAKVESYLVGVLNKAGEFDFTKSFTEVEHENASKIVASINDLETNKKYKVAIMSSYGIIRNINYPDNKSYYYSKMDISDEVLLNAYVEPKVEVSFIGHNSIIKLNKNITDQKQWLSKTSIVRVKVKVKNNENHHFNIIINDIEQQSITKQQVFESTVLLNEGNNNIVIKSENNNGDIKIYKYNLVVDSIEPLLIIDNYEDTMEEAKQELLLKGNIESGTILRINEKVITNINNGKFSESIKVPLLTQIINVELEDISGNITKRPIKVYRKFTDGIGSVIIEGLNNTLNTNTQLSNTVYVISNTGDKVKIDPTDIIWSISNTNVISIDSNNKLIINASGFTLIKAGININNTIYSKEYSVSVNSTSTKTERERETEEKVITTSKTIYNGGIYKFGKIIIDIPEGLVKNGATLKVVINNDKTIKPKELIGNIINLTIDKNTKFNKALSITLPVSKDFKGESCAVYYYNKDRLKWMYIGGEFNSKSNLIKFKVNHLTNFAVLDSSKVIKFNDIKNRWSESYIKRLSGLSVVNDIGENKFKPNRDITRAEFLTMLYKISDNKKIESVELPFVDTDKIPNYALEGIKSLYNKNIISGSKVGNKLYINSESIITRAEASQFIYNYLKSLNYDFKGSNEFSDNIPEWANEAIGKLSYNELLSGYPDETFRPGNAITREETACILYMVLKALFL